MNFIPPVAAWPAALKTIFSISDLDNETRSFSKYHAFVRAFFEMITIIFLTLTYAPPLS
jgi:hypothetical protein